MTILTPGESERYSKAGPARRAAELVAIGVGYFILAKLGLALASVNPSASPIWPPTGFAIAAMLLLGPRIWPAILAGAFVANAMTAGTIATSAAIAVGNLLEALAACLLLQQWSTGRDTFATPVGVAKFAAVATVSTVISATIGVSALRIAGFVTPASVADVWMTWWLGDLTGALVVTPVLVLWATGRTVLPNHASPVESAAIVVSAVLIGFVAFSPILEQTVQRDPLGFFAIGPLLWAALRSDQRGTATVTIILAAFAVWGAESGGGPFARVSLNDSFLLVLMFLISVSVPALALSADVAVRRSSEEKLLRARDELDRRVTERTRALDEATRALRSEVEQRKQAEEDLAQAQKLEAVGQVTGGIAHDFNNLLMIVSGHADILKRRIEDPIMLKGITAIQTAAARGEKLTRQLLTFSRRQHLSPVAIDLRDSIETMRGMLTSSLRGNITLTTDIPDGLWPVEADVGEFQLAMLNIAVNARDAMPEGGTFSISVRNVPDDSSAARETVALTFRDTGIGIEPDVMGRIFDPFFTTKPAGKGTGLGLSQVYGFAHQSGGSVTASSKVGEGTVVTVYLPRSHKVVPVSREALDEPGKAAGRVLVVEDNPEVAEVTCSLFTQLGYATAHVENAADALRTLEGGETFDLVFSDVVMPGMDGVALANEIKRRYPQMPIVLASGYSDASLRSQNKFPMLRKPFEITGLEKVVTAAIAAERGSMRSSA